MKREPYVVGCLTLRECALHLGCTERDVRSAIARGDLKSVKQTFTIAMVAPGQLDRYAETAKRTAYLGDPT